MKKAYLTGWLTLLTLVPAFAQYMGNPAAPERLSLREAIAFALTNNPQVQSSQLDVRSADAEVGEIRATGLPQITASADLTDNFKIRPVILPANAREGFGLRPSDQPAVVPFGIRYEGAATANASQLLFDGSYFVGLKAAATYRELSQKQFRQTKRDVVVNVTKAYYGVLVNAEQLDLLDQNIARLDSTFRETQALYESGFAENIDAMRLEVSLNNLRTERQNVERLSEVSLYLLKFQMGMDLQAPLTLTDTLSPDAIKEATLEDNFDYSRRIEYSILQTQKTLADLDLRNTRAGYLPRLSLFARYGFITGYDDLASIFTEQWFGFGAYGLSLNVPIFDGLRRRQTAQKNIVAQRQVEVGFRALKQQIDFERQQAIVTYENSLRNLQTQERNYELAQQVSEVTRKKFEAGLGANLEVVDAEASLKAAQTNYYQALYDAVVAKVDYDKATGQLEVD